MATAYLSTRAGAGSTAKVRTGIVEDYCEFTVPSAGFALNDTVKLFLLPANARVIGFTISMPLIDSNGAPAATLDVGDSAGAQTYVAASTDGSHWSVAHDLVAPGSANGAVQNVLGTRYSADDYLIMKIHAAPATAATTGTIRAWVKYQMDGGSQTGI